MKLKHRNGSFCEMVKLAHFLATGIDYNPTQIQFYYNIPLGITCAMAWQLPHEPYDDDLLKEQFQKDDEPKRRIDENITDISLDYVDRNYNSLDASNWNEIFKNQNVSYSSSWDDTIRFVYVIRFVIFNLNSNFWIEKISPIKTITDLCQLENQRKSIWLMQLLVKEVYHRRINSIAST